MHNKARSLSRLKQAVAESLESDSIPLSSELSADMKSLMERYAEEMLDGNGEDSFRHIFWKQQMNALSLKNKKSIRWHPLIIKWCLYLHYKSSGAYETLRKSGLLALPSGRTLRDYRHFVPSTIGFSTAVDKQLLKQVHQTKPSATLAQHVGLLIDEMYIKEGLVYNKFTGSLTGFVQLDEIGTHLLDYESQCQQPGRGLRRSLAK